MSSSPLGGLFSPEQKHAELYTPLSAQASCSSHFHSSVAHGWEEKSKCHHVHPQPPAWIASLVLPFLPTARHCSSGLHTPLPFTFSSHFRQPFPRTDNRSDSPLQSLLGQERRDHPSFPCLHSIPGVPSSSVTSPQASLSPACSLHAVDSVNGICQVSSRGQEGPGSRHLPHCSSLRSGRTAPAKGYRQSQELVDGEEQFRFHSAKRSVS